MAAAKSVGPRHFSLHQDAQTGYGAPSLIFSAYRKYCQCVPEVLPGKSGRGLKLITGLHLVLRLRINGSIPKLPACAFTTRRGTTLPLPLPLPVPLPLPSTSHVQHNNK